MGGWLFKYAGHQPLFDLDFKNNRYWARGAYYTDPLSLITLTRANPVTALATAQNVDGTFSTFAAGALRRTGKGALIEQGAANRALWNRDLTNAAWTKSNVTAAKDQIGIDGVAGSASSLTATSTNGTCLQAITLASGARMQSAFVKRLTGSGNVDMTMDNGSTWTTLIVGASWQQLGIPIQTLANPTVGFRLATSGDAIAVDGAQLETGTINLRPTSPIFTTSAVVTRDNEPISLTDTTGISLSAGTFLAKWIDVPGPDDADHYAFAARVDANNSISGRHSTANAGSMNTRSGGAATANFSSSAALVAGTEYSMAIAYQLDDVAAAFNWGTQPATDVSAAMPVGSLANMAIGNDGTGGSGFLNGYLERLTWIDTRLPNQALYDALLYGSY